jgi:hypothetical protein
MTSRHRAWRSSGSPALAAAPWVIIFSGIVALVVLLVFTLWSGLRRDSSRPGGSGTNSAGEQFPPSLPSPSSSLPPIPGGAAPPPAPGQGGDAPIRTTTRPATATRTLPPASAPAVTSTSPAVKATLRDAYAVLQAESFDARSGGTVVACDEGGKAVSALGNGDWIRYDGVDFGSSRAVDFMARVASGLSGGGSGLVQVRLGSPSSTPIGDFAIDNTGGWQTWRSVPGNVTGPTGVHTVYLTFSSAQPADFVAVNWLTFRT